MKNMKKAAVIIQVRTDSSRLPKKVLMKIQGKPMLWHIIQRCKTLKIPVIVATTTRSIDDPIIKIAKECNVLYFRGSTKDALNRFYQAAKKYSVDIIIRATGDNPLVDPRLALKILNLLKSGKADYAVLDKNYPEGLSVEGFTFNALQEAWKHTKKMDEREHISPYIKNSKDKFRVKFIQSKKNLCHFKFTVDYAKDLKFVRRIYSKLDDGKIFFMNDILKFLEQNQ